MPISVDQCPNFSHNICKKCGRMMPAYCLDQETLEDKARKFDEMMAKSAEAPGHTDLMVSPESIKDLVQEDKPAERPKPTTVLKRPAMPKK